ncbi:ROK family protein [uncultured Sphingomonas sp.]|uniref:ROK family protein n=1 Tax=uncultured Sphingomonas sp. TaxID=158754 RepID=UPI002630EB46|nr:ROK family protein [uncultured Sphingomonas sp.]
MTEAADRIVAGVELGGTKSIVLIGRGREILVSERFPTTDPATTLGALSAKLAEWRDAYAPEALGIGSFGPIALDANGADFGRMLATPKPHWAGADVRGALAEGFGDRIAIHTDVTGAALAEGFWGAAKGLTDHVYVTVGTGVGMGIVSGGHPVSGRMHPEAGHVRVRRMPGDSFTGVCPFHGDCLEGLVSGPAIAARAGRPAQELDAHDPAWTFVADALAESFVGLFLTLACGRIVVGGGVGMGQQHLLPMVQQRVVAKLAGYLPFVDAAQVANRIVHAQLGDQAGPLGTLALAQTALPAR